VLVPVRDYNTLSQLDWLLGQPDAEDCDVVVLTVRVLGQGHGTPGLSEDQIFSEYEQTLFTRVVAIAERHGRRVTLLVTPGTNIFDALAQSAVQLRSGLIVVGESEIMAPSINRRISAGEAGSHTARSRTVDAIPSSARTAAFSGSRSVPTCRIVNADIDRIHQLWWRR
jgi:hypothetical protein